MGQSTSVAKTINGQRFAVAIASWSCAGLGVMGSVMFALAPLMSLVGASESHAENLFAEVYSLAILVAWWALGVMTNGWVQGRKVSWLWPIIGSLAGIPAAVLFSIFWPLYISAVPLALYLVYFHLSQFRKDEVNAV